MEQMWQCVGVKNDTETLQTRKVSVLHWFQLCLCALWGVWKSHTLLSQFLRCNLYTVLHSLAFDFKKKSNSVFDSVMILQILIYFFSLIRKQQHGTLTSISVLQAFSFLNAKPNIQKKKSKMISVPIYCLLLWWPHLEGDVAKIAKSSTSLA